MCRLANAYQDAGRLSQALPLCEEIVKLETEHFGPEHIDTLVGMHNLAVAYLQAGHYQKAIQLAETTLALWRKVLGPEHPFTLGEMALWRSAIARRVGAKKPCE